MAKVLRCGDLMPGCNAVIEGKDEAEVMAKGALGGHLKTGQSWTGQSRPVAAQPQA